MTDYAKLKQELDTDPLARGYATKSDKEAADDLNTFYRDGPAGGAEVMQYLITQRARSNIGDDTNQTAIFGRLKAVAAATYGSDPLGMKQGNTITLEVIHAASAVLAVAESRDVSFNLTDTEFQAALNALRAAGVWKAQDRDAIVALSQGRQSRAQELGLGRVKEGDVQKARALP